MSLIDALDWVEEMRDDLRENMSHHRHAPQLDPAKCGTPAQYRQHLRLGIPLCGSCKQAEAMRNWHRRLSDGEKLRANSKRWYAENKDAINRRRRERSRV